ncbi:MAG TPA: hypothetical protein PKY87_14080 [Terricaulis sp.]|nr:hypothetical protein [Terricaulis sp.]
MRRSLILLAFALAACEPAPPPPPLPETLAAPAPWFICDAINMPAVLVFERTDMGVEVAHYDKPNGALVERSLYQLGAEDGAAGSVLIALLQNGEEAGAIRRINSGMLETPTSAYTVPFVSVRLGDAEAQCRWMPRTRVFAVTGKRSIVLHEDGDGDLIYTSYDFADAASADPIQLSDNARTTTFSAEVRGGEESVSPDGESHRFRAGPVSYSVSIERNGEGALQVTGAPSALAPEPFIAMQRGVGAD